VVKLLALAAFAHAGEPAPDALPAGTSVRITAIRRADAYRPLRRLLVGMPCRVEEPGLVRNGRDTWGGPMRCADGDLYYFYQVDVRVLDPSEAAAIGVPEVVVPGAEGGPPPSATPPPGGPVPTWPAGARGTVRALSEEDAYAHDAARLVGRACIAEAELAESGRGWWSGPMRCGEDRVYFFQVSLAREEVATDGSWPPGTRLRVAGIDDLDALAPQRGALVGHHCTVAEAPLVASGPDTWAGRLFCDDGARWQVFRARISAPTPP
jgi:hypothetical protein